MNSNFDPEVINAANDISGIFLKIYEKYDERKATESILNIVNRIRKGGSYHDIYKYCREIGIEKIIKSELTAVDWLDYREQYEELAEALFDTMKMYAQDINDLAEVVQKAINDEIGINIKPQRVNTPNGQINAIIDEAIGINGSIDTLESNILKFSATLTDEIIQKNAEIQSKSGFDIVVVRTYDDVGIHNYANYADVAKRKTIRGARVCSFCKSREGTYNYEEVRGIGNPVWQRHQGCTCSIDFVNKGMTERVKNYVNW